MAIRALKCPSCGADITLDDSREFGFCSYCGSRIQIGEQINVHVTHEFKGDAPNINVTNQYYYADDADVPRPQVTVEKPGNKRLGWGIVLAVLGIVGLSASSGKAFSYVLVCLLMIAVAVILLISYSRDMKLYREAIRNAANINTKNQNSRSQSGNRQY